MKKLLVLLLVICIGVLCFSACGGNTDDQKDPADDGNVTDTPTNDPTDDPGNIPDKECSHTGGTATCTALAICDKCGEEYGEKNPENHNPATVWGSENGTHFHACANGCGMKFDEADCSGGTATCVDKAVCSTCNNKYGELSETHTPADDWTTADGKHYHTCVYGCDVKLDEAECSGGTATCKDKALCASCGEAYGELATTHAPASEWTSTDGKHYHECLNGCGTRLDEADCDGEADCMNRAVCSVCNKEHGGTVASAHTPASEWTSADGKHYHECLNGCGAKLDEADCDGTASCVAKAKCSVCNKEHGEIDENAHNFELHFTDDIHFERCKNGCGTESVKVAHEHGEWKVQIEATPESYGVLESVCACGHKITKESAKSEVLAVKGGANGAVVIIHDDGTLSTALILDALYKKYGLVGDVAMQVGNNGSSKLMDTNTASNTEDDTYNGSVIASWREILATGRWKVDSHSMTHQYWGNGETVTEDIDLINYEVVKSQEILRNLFPGQRVLTWCYPGFSAQKNIVGSSNSEAIFEKVFSETARDIIEEHYISGRSTINQLLGVTDTEADYLSKFAGTAYAEENAWNFFPALSLSDGNVSLAKSSITAAAENGGILIMFMHNVVDVMPEDKSNKMLTSSMEAITSHLSTYVKDGTIWNTHYEDAILYLREAQTSTLYTEKAADGSLIVTLTDEMDDEIYNLPLTVRISVPEEWAAVKVVQGDRVSYAKVTDGTFDAEIVPDGGEAIITPTDISNVPEAEENDAPTPSNDSFNRIYDFASNTDTYFITSTIGGKVTGTDSLAEAKSKVGFEILDAQGGLLRAYKFFAANASDATSINTNLIIPGGFGTISPKMLDVSFDICINSAEIYKNNSYNALCQIQFASSTPISIFMGYDSAKGQWYIGESTTVIYAYFDIGQWYNIQFRFIMGETPTLAIFADGEFIGESTNFNAGKTDFTYINFIGQTRGIYDMYLDNLAFKSSDEIKEYCKHELSDTWITNGKTHSKVCSLCSEVLLTDKCDAGCGESCLKCGYNFGISAGHTFNGWTETSKNNYSAICTRCGAIISTSFAETSNPSGLEITKDPAGSDLNVLYYHKYPNEANKGYNTEFTVNVGSYSAKKVNVTFGVYVDSAELALLAGETSSGNLRMVQLYISNFFKPFIGLDKNTPDKWIMGHLTSDDKTTNYTDYHFDFDKWYTVSIDMFLDTNTAVVYVDGVAVGSYNKCNGDVDTITSVRFLGQYRCKCDVYLNPIVVTAGDSTVNESYDFENGLTDVNYSTTHENCLISAVPDPDDADNTALKLDRTGNSGSYIFNLPSAEKAAEAVTLKFRIRIGADTTNNAELRIMLSNDNNTTPYMASLMKRDGYFEIWDRASSTEAIKKSQKLSDEKFALDTWYEVTIVLHINCCDYFIAEWTLVGTDGVEYKAYSQQFAMQGGDETKPETTVSHIRFWAVGNNWKHYYYLDDVSIRAGGAGAVAKHHSISEGYSAKDGSHFKTCECCENIFALEKCTTTEATCTEKATCTVCGTKYGEVNPEAHTVSESLSSNAESKTHYNTCTNGCGAIFNETACTISEATCAAPAACTVCAQVYAPALDHTYVGDVTYNHDATATKDGTVTGYCSVCDNAAAVGVLHGSSQLVKEAYEGLTVSVIGDSISTYKDISNGAATETTNSTMTSNTAWYSDGGKPSLKVGLNDTWWMQTINAFSTSLLVNNSWSGSLILPNSSKTGAYNTRAFQLHDDTGDNAGEEPDIIFVYMGTNDVNVHSSNIGSIDDIDFDNIAALREKDPATLTVLEAYVIMIDNIRTTYENAEIYCLNVLECRTYYTNETKTKALADFNAGTAVIAEQLGAIYVDICGGTGIGEDNMEEFIPIYDDDDTANNYHPNAAGMTLIADCVIKAISKNSSDMPSDSDFLALMD